MNGFFKHSFKHKYLGPRQYQFEASKCGFEIVGPYLSCHEISQAKGYLCFLFIY